jgi:hypothetical protein
MSTPSSFELTAKAYNYSLFKNTSEDCFTETTCQESSIEKQLSLTSYEYKKEKSSEDNDVGLMHHLLTPNQLDHLRFILNERHFIESQARDIFFSCKAPYLLKKIASKNFQSTGFGFKENINFYLIGSKACSLFRSQVCGDTDILLKCTVKIPREYLFANQDPESFLLFVARQYLHCILINIEEAVREIFETSSQVKQYLTLKNVFDLFFTKRNLELKPLSLKNPAPSNRFGMVRVGKTLEIKYCIDFEIDGYIHSGLENAYSFIQDDLRILLDDIIRNDGEIPQKVSVFSLENPIEHVITSIIQNELTTPKPDGSKFIAHLTKMSLKEGITTREHIQENLSLFLQEQSLEHIEGRLRNALKGKSPYAIYVCITNFFHLINFNASEFAQKSNLVSFLENLLKENLHVRGGFLTQSLQPQITISWISLMLLLNAQSFKGQIASLSIKEDQLQLIRPNKLLDTILILLKHFRSYDMLMDLYKTLLPALQFNEIPQTSLELVYLIVTKTKLHLNQNEMRKLSQFILFHHPSIFELCSLRNFLSVTRPLGLDEELSYNFCVLSGLEKKDTSLGLPQPWSDDIRQLLSQDLPFSEKINIIKPTCHLNLYPLDLDEIHSEEFLKNLIENLHKAHETALDLIVLNMFWLLEKKTVIDNKEKLLSICFNQLQASFQTLLNFEQRNKYLIQMLEFLKAFLDHNDIEEIKSFNLPLTHNFLPLLILNLSSSANPQLNEISISLIKNLQEVLPLLPKEDIRDFLLTFLMNIKENPSFYTEITPIIESCDIFNEKDDRDLCYYLLKYQSSLNTESLKKIITIMDNIPCFTIIPEQYKKFIFNQGKLLVKEHLKMPLKRGELEKIKDLCLLLYRMHFDIEEDMPDYHSIWENLLKITFERYPEKFNSYLLHAKKCGCFLDIKFCQNIEYTLQSFLKTASFEIKKAFIIQIREEISIQEVFYIYFQKIINESLLSSLQIDNPINALKIYREHPFLFSDIDLLQILSSNLDGLIQSLNKSQAIIEAKKLLNSDIISFFQESPVLNQKIEQLVDKSLSFCKITLQQQSLGKKSYESFKAYLALFFDLIKNSKFTATEDFINTFYDRVTDLLISWPKESFTQEPLNLFSKLLNIEYAEQGNYPPIIFKQIIKAAKSSNSAFEDFSFESIEFLIKLKKNQSLINPQLFYEFLEAFELDKKNYRIQELFFLGVKQQIIDEKTNPELVLKFIQLIFENLYYRSPSEYNNDRIIETCKKMLTTEWVYSFLAQEHFSARLKPYQYFIKASTIREIHEDYSSKYFYFMKQLLSAQVKGNFQGKVEQLELIFIDFINNNKITLPTTALIDLLQFLSYSHDNLFKDNAVIKYHLYLKITLTIVLPWNVLNTTVFTNKSKEKSVKKFLNTLRSISESIHLNMNDPLFLQLTLQKTTILPQIFKTLALAYPFDESLIQFCFFYLSAIQELSIEESIKTNQVFQLYHSILEGLYFCLEIKKPLPKQIIESILANILRRIEAVDINDPSLLDLLINLINLLGPLSIELNDASIIETIFNTLLQEPLKEESKHKAMISLKIFMNEVCLKTNHHEVANQALVKALKLGIIGPHNKDNFKFLALSIKNCRESSSCQQIEKRKSLIDIAKDKPLPLELLLHVQKNYYALSEAVKNFIYVQEEGFAEKFLIHKIGQIQALLHKQIEVERKAANLCFEFIEISKDTQEMLNKLKKELSSLSFNGRHLFGRAIYIFISFLYKRSILLNPHRYTRLFGANQETIHDLNPMQMHVLFQNALNTQNEWLTVQGISISEDEEDELN